MWTLAHGRVAQGREYQQLRPEQPKEQTEELSPQLSFDE
jgi:hypothetical protein